MEQKNELTTTNQNQLKAYQPVSTELDLMNEQIYGQAWKVAQVYAKGNIPANFRGKPEAVLTAMVRAKSLGIDIFYFMDHSFEVYGKIGMDGQLIMSILNTCPQIKGTIWFEFDRNKDNQIISCTAFAEKIIHDDKTQIVQFMVDCNMVRNSGWDNKTDKSGKFMPSLWNTNPELMYRYRSVTYLGRTEFPHILGGIRTKEEIIDEHYREIREAEAHVIEDDLLAPPELPNKNESSEPKKSEVSPVAQPDKKEAPKPEKSKRKRRTKAEIEAEKAKKDEKENVEIPKEVDQQKSVSIESSSTQKVEEIQPNPENEQANLIKGIAVSKTDFVKKLSAIIEYVKKHVKQADQLFFSKYLIELGYLNQGDKTIKQLTDDNINKLGKNLEKVITDYNEKMQLRNQYIGAVIGGLPTYDEQRRFNAFLVVKGLKKGKDYSEITLDELRTITPVIKDLISEFQTSKVDSAPHPADGKGKDLFS